ncbi:HNH endonuclease signature motif containing protein [Sphingomonas oleivorans]|uniref:HNH endonuclease signature motif containing protein n=1 Tax=Sphingomonas oleivorans TaxID=1735121 RepID=UPI001056F3D0|nr:HNH endonuclease signature motif containing protein [Sphingomonas oleivorans]
MDAYATPRSSLSKEPYDSARPHIPADIRRLVLVEAGHGCALRVCGETTYVELHHIDENRENNDPANLIALCDMHHKMAHDGKIDRKSLRLYKERLSASRESEIVERLTRLEAQSRAAKSDLPVPETSAEQPTDASIRKIAAPRWQVQAFALGQVAITRYEKEVGVYCERHVELVAGEKRLVLDGLKQFQGDQADIVIDFVYVRKAYLDAPAYAKWVQEKLEVYELMTGWRATGVLLAVVGKDTMLEETALPEIRSSVRDAEGVTLQAYSCGQLGFHPGPISASLF